MARTISIGAQDFEKLRVKNCFYIDKTDFLKEWWYNADIVTLITRPRRFGKTLNMSMLNCFFSLRYQGRGEELFSGLDVWKDKGLRVEQGCWPVIFLSFAGVKERKIDSALHSCCSELSSAFSVHRELLGSAKLLESEKRAVESAVEGIDPDYAGRSLRLLSDLLYRAYGKKTLIFLDEYDTPLQEAYTGGYWDEMSEFLRSLFNNSFKTNPSLERAVLTGITRIGRESMFSDLNNPAVVGTTSRYYQTCFGFTEAEVFAAMDEFGLSNREEVKDWYDGFTFGDVSDIYNPWSITNYLKNRKVESYWANTSSNVLISKLIRQGGEQILEDFEKLLAGGEIQAVIREDVVFGELSRQPDMIWSLLLASGYLRVLSVEGKEYRLALTNREVRESFEDMTVRWFDGSDGSYNAFQKALLSGKLQEMNNYMRDVVRTTVSNFDSGTRPSEARPERFYHGLVLGLSIDLRDRYDIRSNRESGYGRYDVMMIPKRIGDPGILMEYKVLNREEEEEDLSDTAAAALRQIEEKRYAQELLSLGIPNERIRKYGFAFCGKDVLIRQG